MERVSRCLYLAGVTVYTEKVARASDKHGQFVIAHDDFLMSNTLPHD